MKKHNELFVIFIFNFENGKQNIEMNLCFYSFHFDISIFVTFFDVTKKQI